AGKTVYGKCQVDLGGVGTAAPKARNALVRLFARPMAGGVPGRGRAGDTERILVDRRGHEAEKAERQAIERSVPFALGHQGPRSGATVGGGGKAGGTPALLHAHRRSPFKSL